MRKAIIAASTIAVVSGLTVIGGCGSDKKEAVTERAYAGAGSDWRWNLKSDGTFTGTESESSTTVSGNYEKTSTGFIKATVKASSGAKAPAVGAVLAGVEIPGFSLLWAPILSTETQIQGNIAGGNCPTADFDANFLYVQFATNKNIMDASQQEAFGNATYTVADGKTTINHKYALPNSFAEIQVGNTAITGGTCAKGIVSNASFNLYLTPGAGLVKVIEPGSPSLGDSLIFMPVSTITSLSAIDGNYAGFVYNESDTTATRPITVSISNGTVTVTQVVTSDLVTARADSDTATLTAVDSPSAGFIKGYVGSASNPLVCMAGLNVLSSGKNSVFCLGKNPSNNSPYAIVMASR